MFGIGGLTKAIKKLTCAINSHGGSSDIEHLILSMEAKLMAKSDDILALIEQINVNTNEQADEVARVRGILEQLQADLANGVTAEQAAEIQARLESAVASTQGVEDALRGIGAEPPVEE